MGRHGRQISLIQMKPLSKTGAVTCSRTLALTCYPPIRQVLAAGEWHSLSGRLSAFESRTYSVLNATPGQTNTIDPVEFKAAPNYLSTISVGRVISSVFVDKGELSSGMTLICKLEHNEINAGVRRAY